MPIGIYPSVETRAKLSAAKVGNQYGRGHSHTPPNKLPIGSRNVLPVGRIMMKTEKGWQLEHRAIFEKAYGYLPEAVHHIDGNSLNNALENLEGMTNSEHVALHRSR